MATIKNKNIRLAKLSKARVITSIIVPFREKNRAPKLAAQDFRNSTISLFLFPGVYCSVSELPKTMHKLVEVFRSITNCDIRYQQKQDNLPSFLAVRDCCVRFSSPEVINVRPSDVNPDVLDEIVWPYLRITIDNVQVAAFIIKSWCARIGAAPHVFEWCFRKDGKLFADSCDFFKCTPLYVERLCEDLNIETIQFGKAAKISTLPVDRNSDLYNIPGVRASQKFGTSLSIYSTRKLQRIREAQAKGTLERIRIGRNSRGAIEAIEWRRAVNKQRYMAMTGWDLFPSHFYHSRGAGMYNGQRYNAIGKYGNWSAERTDKEIARMRSPKLLERFPDADDIIMEFDELKNIALAANRVRAEVEEELNELKAASKEAVRHDRQQTEFKTTKRARNYVCDEFMMCAKSDKVSFVEAESITEAVNTLAKYFDFVVDKKGNKIILK